MLESVLRSGLDLVVCGSAAGTRSAMRGHYYAGPGNKFWRTLKAIGLTDRELLPSEYRLLLDCSIGLTDLVKHQAGNDDAIRFAKKDAERLRREILKYQPRFLCFNGKRAAGEFFGTKSVKYGFQEDAIGITKAFVAPSTSGAANGAWDETIWRDLARRVRPKGVAG